MELFKAVVLNEAEELELVQVLRTPVLVKYLKAVAEQTAFDLVNARAMEFPTAVDFQLRASFSQGGVAIISEMLEVAYPPQPTQV